MLFRRLVAMASVTVCLVAYTLAAQAQPDLVQFREHTELARNRYVDRPEINPSPQRSLLIQVHKDPRIELWLDSSYGTGNEECWNRTAIAQLLGAPKVGQVVYDSVRLPAGQSDFSVRFFLDRYLPGRCKWHPMAIGHAEFLPEDSNHPNVHSGVFGLAPPELPTPLSVGPVGLSETEMTWVCHRRESTRSHVEELFCGAVGRVLDRQWVSIEGGHAKIEFALAPD